MKNLLLAICLIMISLSASATPGSGPTARDLNKYCVNEDGSCSAYMVGFIEGMAIGHVLEFTGKNFSSGTLEDVFKKEMRHHPEKGDENAMVVLSQLLKKYGWYRVKH